MTIMEIDKATAKTLNKFIRLVEEIREYDSLKELITELTYRKYGNKCVKIPSIREIIENYYR